MPVSDASILKSTLAWGCGSSTWSLLAVSRRDQPLQLCRLHVEAGPTASPVRCPLCLSKAVIYSTPPERPVVAGSSPSLPDGSNPSAAIVQSASDVQCSRLLKTTAPSTRTRTASSKEPR